MIDFLITTVIRVAGAISMAHIIYYLISWKIDGGDIIYVLFIFIWLSGEYSWWKKSKKI
jgi:hypothetical protein